MPITIEDVGKIAMIIKGEVLTCPKCGNNKVKQKGCCGHERWECTKCEYSGPRRIFIEGLPSEKGRK